MLLQHQTNAHSRAYLQALGIAGPTAVAVEKIGSTTHSAEVAVVAVKVSLGWVILKEVAIEATVLTKRSPTLNAGGLNRLPCTTQGADDLAHVLSIQAVPLASTLRDML